VCVCGYINIYVYIDTHIGTHKHIDFFFFKENVST